MYNLNIFGKIIFAVTINYDVIGIQATEYLEKCEKKVFEIVSPSDYFQTIENEVTLVVKLLQ